MAKEVMLKKYTNRRLYNTDEGRYIKLDEIGDIIRQGNDIKVIDTKTKEDITKQILAQIILEEEKNKKDLLPKTLLYQIIRANEDFIRDFFENYLSMTMESYLSYRELMEKKVKEMSDISRLPYEMGEIFMKSFGFMGKIPSDKT
ncbi:MAG TPA: polyhydroxyalkanoate synthesis regulator DNA-binding domain-containing protein [Candidatus Eremiobacteraeota bacterium]|nr:MAG: PHB/PHA accumulation regulator DNA-binding domain protein [bacterium ADurb.Bin363]HPZ07953.1 polyhydroxyalkanoate synthesis regulator DNA-binding domain-containing protein [Candidatus Eremiobacteraeota bacterium]